MAFFIKSTSPHELLPFTEDALCELTRAVDGRSQSRPPDMDSD
jgi:hypothetical protein